MNNLPDQISLNDVIPFLTGQMSKIQPPADQELPDEVPVHDAMNFLRGEKIWTNPKNNMPDEIPVSEVPNYLKSVAPINTTNSPYNGKNAPTVTRELPRIATDKVGVRNLVLSMAEQEFGKQELGALDKLMMVESGYNPEAQNPKSTAYGIFQFLDQTWKNYGHTKTNSPILQTKAGLEYIKKRYGTPQNAWAFWNSINPETGKVRHYY